MIVYEFYNFLKIFGIVRKSSDNFVKIRKRLKTIFEDFYGFLKFSKFFGNVRKLSESIQICVLLVASRRICDGFPGF